MKDTLKVFEANKKPKLVSVEDLARHESDLDDSNMHCYVPLEQLRKLFRESELEEILAYRVPQKENIRYNNTRHVVSIGPLNAAFVWSQVLGQAKLKGNKIVELGPGKSVTVDLALCFSGFQGTLVKIDNTQWEKSEEGDIDRTFKEENIMADIAENPETVPESDMVIMNHFLDDLFMGLWAKDKNIDYFGPDFNKVEKDNEYWQQAMRESDKYVQKIIGLINKVSEKVKTGGFVVIKNFPSAFETVHRQADRVNFTARLTDSVVKALKDTGFKPVATNLAQMKGSKAAKYPNSFFVLEKVA